MTISSSTNKVLLNGDGSTTTFTFNFALLKSDYSDLYVYQIDVDEDTQEETQTLLTAGVDYNISVLKDTNLNILGGSITTTFVPTINQKIFIVREENLLQETKIEINQKFPERVIELTLDKLTLISQQQQALLDKSLKISQTSSAVISDFADTPVENMGVVWKKNENGEFYLSNTKDNPDTVYNDIVNNPNVVAVGTNIDNVNIVATNSTNINSVAGDLTNIDNVAGDLTNINNVANDLSNVDIVANNINNVNTNATNISSINTNATNISNINIVANNIATIQEKANIDGSNVNENFFTGANFTADTIDYIVESGSNANGYYKKFKSGKTIQGRNNINGGTLGAGQGSQVVITLPTPTQSTNYIVNVNFDNSFTYYASVGYAVMNKTTTGFEINQYNNANGTTGTIYYNYSIIEF